MTTTICPEARIAELCSMIGITEPGAVAIREPDGRLMVWASERDSENDDGQRACYRSRGPISDALWVEVARLAWVESAESI